MYGYNPYQMMYSQQQKEVERLQDQLKAINSKPERPEYEYLINPETGLLQDQYQITDQMNTAALDQLRTEAMRDPGSQSAWALLQNEQIQNQGMNDLNSLNRQGQSIYDQQMADLAVRGGYDQGAQERMGANSFREMLRAKQNQRNNTSSNLQNIAIQDEQNRLTGLNNLNAAEMNRANYLTDLQRSNSAGALAELDSKRNYDTQVYGQDMNAWAANQTANAQSKAAGSCFTGDTKIEMLDGSSKNIKDIELGEEIKFGGKVTGIHKFLMDDSEDLYIMGDNITVTGTHAVFDERDQKWKRVKDYSEATKSVFKAKYIYNLTTEKHMIYSRGALFSDFEENDLNLNPEASIYYMNNKRDIDEFRSAN